MPFGGGSPSMGSFNQQPDGEDLEPEERERIMKAENDRQDRMRQQYLKQEEEQALKQQRKQKGREELAKWQEERKLQMKQRRETNKKMETEYHDERRRLKDTTNTWERIVSNVEINANNYVGQGDVTRMRQAMLSRKSDITKGKGGNVKMTF